MMRMKHIRGTGGFTLVEMVFSVLVLGIVLIALAGIFILFQKSSATTTDYAEAQQNARIAVDFITEILRQAGSQTDYFRGQRAIVHAGPYQVVINADIDNGRTFDGLGPLTAVHPAYNPKTVPPTGTILYYPELYQSTAETIVLTLDSNDDGVISGADRGDDPEERGLNRNLFMLRRIIYGYNGAGRNEMRASNLALVRGPNLAPTWTTPEPLFQYWYDHDDNPATADRLWGDSNGNGILDGAEIGAVTEVTSANLPRIRKIRTTAIAESNRYNKRYETNGGFLAVSMNSEVSVRNATRTSSNIYGRVYHDANSNGALDAGESGIYNVEIRVAGTSRSTRTDNFGNFYLSLPPGDYSIQEIDPPGYTSTTANLVAVSLAAGQTQVVYFGDRSNLPVGTIRGTVFEDLDQNGVKSADERGLPSVLVSLDNGAETYTNNAGYYSFVVQQGNYQVVETDPIGYSSTTPNSASASIVNEGDTVTVNFGDYAGIVYGTLHGYVYLDTNEDGVRGGGEEGLPNVVLRVSSGDSTMTNAKGYFKFTLAPGTYSLTETDPAGYTSTTVNTFTNILIAPDTFVVRNFGDILQTRTDFVEIHISNTDRVLSVATTDLREDGQRDQDIVLGTALVSGLGNMLIFHNQWETSTMPITELFKSEPTYRRDAGQNINTMSRGNLSGDAVPDILTGLDCNASPNIQVWFTGSGGVLSTSPDASYVTGGANVVMDSKLADLDGDGDMDLVVGLRSPLGIYSGGFQIFRGSGGSFSSHQYVTKAGTGGSINLGEIWAVETGDMNGDGHVDIVVGSHGNAYLGHIDIYLNDGSGTVSWHSRYRAPYAVNDLKVVDMMEDDAGDPDIVAAVSSGPTTGAVLLWLNEAGVFGQPDTTGYAFGAEETPRWPDDWVDAEGAALCLSILHLNRDIFPDVAYGTRNSVLYEGNIYVLPCYGTLPDGGQKINQTFSGEIITMDVADFNKDNRPDLVVGTRTSAAQGKLVAYFGRDL